MRLEGYDMTRPDASTMRRNATILYRARPFTVFKTLLWAEFAPRRQVLGAIFGFLVLFWLFAESQTWALPNRTHPGPTPFEGLSRNLAVGGVLYSIFSQGRTGFSIRQSWQGLALPVRLRWLVAPGIVFQLGMALFIALIWGLYRDVAEIEHPFSYPLILLVVLAAQGHCAMLWCGALGITTGLAVFGAGLTVATVVGIVVSGLAPLPPAACTAAILVLFGWIWSAVAAGAIRGNSLNLPDLRRVPIVNALYTRHLSRAASKTTFRSPFSAQCWFEWKRSARWYVAFIAVSAIATLVIEVPYTLTREASLFDTGMGDGATSWFRPIEYAVLAAPLLFWFIHSFITRAYRGFVCTRPISARCIGGAKLVIALTAAIAGYGIVVMCNQFLNFMVTGEMTAFAWPGWGEVLTSLVVVIAAFLFMSYGLVLLALSMALFSLSMLITDDIPGVQDPGFETNIFLLTVMLLAFLPIAAVDSALKRLDLSAYPKPWEVWRAFGATMSFVLLAAAERFTTATALGQFAFTWIGPGLIALATVHYGWRAGVLARPAVYTMAALYIILLPAGTWLGTRDITNFWFGDGPCVGYWIVIAIFPIMMYPLLVDGQRRETSREGSGMSPHWVLILISPFAWVAFHLIGERYGEEEGGRT
jgi:hypothetical protein